MRTAIAIVIGLVGMVLSLCCAASMPRSVEQVLARVLPSAWAIARSCVGALASGPAWITFRSAAFFVLGCVVTSYLQSYFRAIEERRRSRMQAADLLSKRGISSVREVLREVPNWIEDPDIETVEWLNKFLKQRLWYYISSMAGEQVRQAIDAAFKSPPKPLSTVSLLDFTLGTQPPTITGVRFIERTKHQVAHLEMGIIFSSDQNIVLEVSTVTGLGLHVGVENFYFRGTLRVMLGPLMDNPWCATADAPIPTDARTTRSLSHSISAAYYGCAWMIPDRPVCCRPLLNSGSLAAWR